MKMKLSRWLYNTLGADWGGTPSPPGSECELDFGELDGNKNDPSSMRPMYVARTYCNDGFELWLGTHDKWHVFYSAKHARRLAWFILWDWWAVSTWFGLKRELWYWALHNIVEHRRSNNRLHMDAGDSPRQPSQSTLEGFTPAEQGTTPAPRQ